MIYELISLQYHLKEMQYYTETAAASKKVKTSTQNLDTKTQ